MNKKPVLFHQESAIHTLNLELENTTSAPIITSNWEADSGDKWTVPLGGGIGKIFRIGEQPVNLSTCQSASSCLL